MEVIDFHSHTLPGIDDGSRNVVMSIEMLRLSAGQGVDVIAATPHFYAWKHRIGTFLERRKEALEALYKRESQQSTAIDARVAIPHCICEGLDKIQLAIGLSPEGVEFDCSDLTKEGESKIRKPKLIFEILFTKDDTSAHLQVLKEIVGLISNNELIENIILAKNAQEVFNFIKEYDY